ncbi:MAG: hypothetical protein EXS03_06795 [Phycisphaerales bacterium]|nr:hypothetical protein [Phycisphaerales bacterium]
MTDSLMGLAIGLFASRFPQYQIADYGVFAATVAGLCSFYLAGMVLNAIVDRRIDARERPLRQIASGRIRLPSAWTAFVILMFLGFFMRPSYSSAPLSIAVAALIGIWTLASANAMRSIVLKRLARGWCVIAIGAAIWWAIDSIVRDPFDLSAFPIDAYPGARSIRVGSVLLNGTSVLLAVSLVAYNLLHTKTAWAIAFLALCRFLVPISVALEIVVSNGTLGGFLNMIDSVDSSTATAFITWAVAVITVAPLSIAIHTVVLSMVARREVPTDAPLYRCARCGYLVSPSSTLQCSECGCLFAATPPLGERQLEPRARRASIFIAPLALVPLLALAAVGVTVVFQTLISGAGVGAVGPMSARFLVLRIPLWVEFTILAALFVIAVVWFAIASIRGFRAAISHASRRPQGVGAMIAAFALLDAIGATIYGSPFIALVCIALWFVTRMLQRRIPAS